MALVGRGPPEDPEVVTLADAVKRTFEERCTAEGIEFKRRGGGLRLNLFASPEIHMSVSLDAVPTFIYIQMVGGMHSLGDTSSRYYSTLKFAVGDVADPATDVQAVIDRVMGAVLCLRTMSQLATTVSDQSF